MASSENNNDLHGPGRGERRDDGSDLGQEESEAGPRTEIGVKRSSGALVWSPPHLLHRHSQSQHQQSHEHQNHRMHLNPFQYVQQESRPRIMTNSRQPLSISTTAPSSPANGISNHSPISRSSSKASSPTTFYRNANNSTLYHPPHLHFTHQQPVKETHRLDLDFDPISGRKSINKYEIIDEIGRGTHGKVKLGRDLTSDEYVAIKIVERHSRPRLGKIIRQDDEKVRREIAILKKCRHPNVVRLIEVIDDPASKKVYLVLEYVELGEIVWRKFGPRDVLRRERNRLKRELTGEVEGEVEEEDSDGERIRRWKRRRKQLKEGRPSTGTSNLPSQTSDENPNFWSLELGGLTEEDDEATDDDYPSMGEGECHEISIVDAPHIPPLDSDAEEPSHLNSSLSMIALGPNPDTPPYSFSHEDLQYIPALTFEQARSTFRDTVLGLEYLHYHGIIHRDIKPANLLWTKNYRVKISDFGVSYLGRGAGEEDDEEGSKRKKDQFSGRDKEIELAKTVGTPAFFAPELCFFDTSKPRPQITSAIDVWALGVTLYCLIFARCPFLADGEFELFNVIARQELFIPQRRLRPGQGYSASVKSLSRPSSSNQPLSLHHQRTHSGMSAKTSPTHPRPASGPRGKDSSEDHETEIIPDELRDLLEKLLTKDPSERISIKEVKSHRWVLQGIANPMVWLENTDPERLNGGGRIEVNEEEMEKAVVPASWTTGMIKQVKSGINRLRQKMGMGGSSSEGTTPKKEKVGLHPLASLGNDPRRPHSFLGANRPGSSSSNSTLQEQGEALNRFSLSLQTGTPYVVPKVVAPPPISASSLTQLLAASPAKSTTSTISNTTAKDMKSTYSPSRVHSPATVKRLFDSQTSLANSLSRSLSRSSHHSDRTAMSGAESISLSTIKKEKKDKILSPNFLRRTRSALTNGGSNINDNNASGGVGGRVNKAVRRATSSNLGHEFTNSPSPSTIRRIPSPSTQDYPSKDQIPKIRLATVPSHDSASQSQIQFVQPQEHNRNGGGGSVSGSATTRSRRSSASSNSTSMIQARDTVAAALGGLFGKGKRLVRSFSRSRDTLASESETVLSTSGGSGDDEGNHRGGLRISMLRRKRSSGVEASPVISPVVSRVNAMGTVRSGTSTAAASPIYESGDGYFDIELRTPADVLPPLGTAATTSPITTSPVTTTTTTAAMPTSASSTSPYDFGSRDPVDTERMQWSKGLNLHDTSCPPSPDDYFMWERQAKKARERREAARKEQDEEMARKLAESLQRIRNDIDTDTSAVPLTPPQQLWQPGQQPGVKPSASSSCNQQPHQPQQHFAPEVNGRLVASSSEERLYPKRGHRHTDTTTSSLTESTSFPSIQSMMDSSAASSVSADAGWPAAAKKITRPVTVPAGVNRDSGVYSLKNGNGSIAVSVEGDMTTAAPEQQQRLSTTNTSAHLAPPQPTLSTPNSAYHNYIHSKSEEDDGDDEALFLDLGTSNRRKSQALGESPRRPKSIVVGVQHHKRAVSSTSARSKASATDREKGTSLDGSKDRARRQRSRSNTANSAIGSGGTGSAAEGRRDRDKWSERKEARNKEKAQRERERAALPVIQ